MSNQTPIGFYVVYAVMFSALLLILGGIIGWAGAHATVATECEKLGGFYVGSKTFACDSQKASP